MSYFDPIVETILVGREAVVGHIKKIYQNPHIVQNEYLNTHVIVGNRSDLAVLSYNLNTLISDGDEGKKLLRAWNSTEVHRLIDGQWRIGNYRPPCQTGSGVIHPVHELRGTRRAYEA